MSQKMNDTNGGNNCDNFSIGNNMERDMSNMNLNEEQAAITSSAALGGMSMRAPNESVPLSIPSQNINRLAHSAVSSISHLSVPAPAGPPPQNISCIQKKTNANSSSSSSRRKNQSSKTCKSNSQALLRAKASLTCPATFRLNTSHTNFCGTMTNRTSVGPALATTPNRSTVQSTRSSSASMPPDSLPLHRAFGLRTSPSSNSIRSSHSFNSIATSPSIDNCKWNKVTSGEWKQVEINPNQLQASEDGFLENDISSVPSARSLHASARWKDQLFIFGGYDGISRRNDFYSFHFKHKIWARIDERIGHAEIQQQGIANASYIYANGQVRGEPPSPRDRHSAVVYKNGFYVFGGFDGHARVNDLYKYDIEDNTWSRIIPSTISTTIPTPRHSHSAVVYKDSMYIFGGYDGSYSCNLYEYNFVNNAWSLVNTVGRIPRARYRASCVMYNDKMIIHAGHDGTRHLSDTHMLDMTTQCWTSLTSVRGKTPFPRDSQIGFLHDNAMYIFGGSAGGAAMNDMHELLLEGSEDDFVPTWRKVICHGTANPRFCHVGAIYEDSLFVFGGYDGNSRLNDFVRFEFNVDDLSYDVPSTTLLNDLHSFINNEALSDISFIIEGQPIHAHKMMLVRSPYFRAMFSGSMMESQQSEIHIEEIPSHIFLSVLEYLYTDHVDFNVEYAMELFAAADLFDIPRLQAMCEKSMLKTIHIENAASIFLTADLHSAKTLREKALKYVLKHFELVSKSAAFEEMARSNVELVVEILRQR